MNTRTGPIQRSLEEDKRRYDSLDIHAEGLESGLFYARQRETLSAICTLVNDDDMAIDEHGQWQPEHEVLISTNKQHSSPSSSMG